MKKILVFGATGMAGHTIAMYLIQKGYDVTAYSRRTVPFCNSICGDAQNEELIRRTLQERDYDAAINCIGMLNKSCDEFPDRAVYVNSYFPHMLASATQNTRTRIIHMSTDCVFSGDGGPYYENSFKDGKTFYDRTKALGELNDSKNLTFRNSIVGPDTNPAGIGLFNWFMKQKDDITGFDGVNWTGVTTLTLAKAIEAALQEELTGVYNLVNNTSITKYEMLQEFNQVMGKGITIHKSNDVKTNKVLINTRKDFSFIVPSYHEMFVDMRNWILNHKEIYGHYFN